MVTAADWLQNLDGRCNEELLQHLMGTLLLSLQQVWCCIPVLGMTAPNSKQSKQSCVLINVRGMPGLISRMDSILGGASTFNIFQHSNTQCFEIPQLLKQDLLGFKVYLGNVHVMLLR